MSYIELTYTQVGLAALLILVNGGISIVLRLGMERTLAWASVRTVFQLVLIGLVLEWVFQIDRWYIVVGLLSLMTLIAGITAGQRNQRRFPGIWFNTIVSVWASSWLVTAYALVCCHPEHRHLVSAAIHDSADGHDPGQFAQRYVHRAQQLHRVVGRAPRAGRDGPGPGRAHAGKRLACRFSRPCARA